MIRQNHICKHVAAPAAALALLLAGCASPANRQAMIPQVLGPLQTHPYSVRVQSSGGSDTGALDSSNISDADLKSAIEEAVVSNKVFKSVVQGKDGDYELSVRVTSLSKPIIGFSFTVDMEAAWSLLKVSDRSVVMRKSIKSSGTATAGDSLVGVTRLRLAVEASARDNISQGLQAVSALKL
ncbi:hypothetical protein [Zoogloea dura]|jgi:hypothetical protein|uniref:Lipoprotein n=1 Tax=Zoogloea dura TaxID=2728840 RepID=A0A848G6M1_9RHOO|nr:hypothetical protein [Zoogloea dura]NML26832.1 hypothetical protein [Zoogloea dura]